MSSNPTTTTTDPTSPPPPPQTTVTTTTPKPTTTTAPPQPQRPIKSPQFHHPLPFQRPPIQPGPFPTQTQLGKTLTDPIRYPLASSGRGLLPSPRLGHHHHPQLQLSSEQMITNSGVYPQTQIQGNNNNSSSSNLNGQHPFLHPSSLPPHFSRLSSSPGRAVLPHSKAASSPYTTPDSIITKDPIEKGTDDQLVTVGDRKVRISDGASLYALCRSWLRNGYLEENKPQYGDVLKSLAKPLPLPLPLPESSPSKRKERDEETEGDEVENVETLTAKELLSRHVKRAKKVRARLREDRLQRIDRYKSRLSLLLPPLLQE